MELADMKRWLHANGLLLLLSAVRSREFSSALLTTQLLFWLGLIWNGIQKNSNYPDRGYLHCCIQPATGSRGSEPTTFVIIMINGTKETRVLQIFAYSDSSAMSLLFNNLRITHIICLRMSGNLQNLQHNRGSNFSTMQSYWCGPV